MAKGNPETNPITVKPETVSHVEERFSRVPLPYCSPPGCPFPVKSLALSAHLSPWTIHFRVLDKSPVSGTPSCSIYVQLNHFAVYMKLTQHCKSTILQLKKRKKSSKTNKQNRIFKYFFEEETIIYFTCLHF